MTLRNKLGSGIESLELRAAPSTLLGTGISLGLSLDSTLDLSSWEAEPDDSSFVDRPTPGSRSHFEGEALPKAAAKPQAVLDAVFAARFAARGGSSERGGGHPSGGKSASLQAVDEDTTEVLNFPTGDQVIEGASSTLRRTPNGISWTLKTSELNASHVHTVWVVVFNNPDESSGLDDLSKPEVAATLAYGGGLVVGPTGEATFSGHLQEGDTSGFPLDSPFVEIPGRDLGLVDASQADIHLVIRDHGPKIPGRVGEQIGSFSGGCDVNACANVQFAAHEQ